MSRSCVAEIEWGDPRQELFEDGPNGGVCLGSVEEVSEGDCGDAHPLGFLVEAIAQRLGSLTHDIAADVGVEHVAEH